MKNLVICAPLLLAVLTACGGSGGSSGNRDTGDGGENAPGVIGGGDNPGASCPTSGAPVNVRGRVLYDHVPPDTSTSGLDYGNTRGDPVRGATVQALCGSRVLVTTKTDNQGNYSVAVAPQTDLQIRVLAEATLSQSASWSVKVVDNTRGQAIYALDSALTNVGTSSRTINLRAPSGFTEGLGYTSIRAAAPFAIHDSIYQALIETQAFDSAVQFPPLTVNWSVNNRPARGSLAAGEIGTSFYSGGNIYILGAENNDTDEYDGHVVVHEWGHYFEDNLSRSDSIGGQHSQRNLLDPRVALGEGFGNALSGIITGDPVYRDSIGNRQAIGGRINVESDDATGWYSEATVQSIIYDLFDANSDSANDNTNLGWGPLYNTFVSANYRNMNPFTTIFSFISVLRANEPTISAAIDLLVDSRGINANALMPINELGSNETNDANNADVLPVYTVLEINGPPETVCSITSFGLANKLSVNRYLTVDIPASGVFRFTSTSLNDNNGGTPNPDIRIFRQGEIVSILAASGDENRQINLSAGPHTLSAYEFSNRQGEGRGRTCFEIAISTN